jgi:hemolysin activation/secretion protein
VLSPRSVRQQFFLVGASCVLSVGAALAQTLPATPPPVTPPLSGQQQFGTRPDPNRLPPSSFSVPPVVERQSEFDEAPAEPYVVRQFQLVGAQDRPEEGIGVAQIQSVFLDPMVAQQSPQGYTLAQMEQIASNITRFYQQRGFITTQVFIPAQDVTDGVIKVQVLEGRLGDVVPKGNELYSARTIERAFAPMEGVPIRRADLTAALLRLEMKYPGFTPGARTLQPGKEVGTSDLVIDVQREDRFEFDIAADNWGTESSGEYRAQFGVTVNNLLGRADQLRLYGIYAFDPSDSDRSNLYGGLAYDFAATARSRISASYSTNYINLRSDVQDVEPATGESQIADVFWRWDAELTKLTDFTLGLGVSRQSASYEFDQGGTFAEDDLFIAIADASLLGIEARERFGAINTLYMSWSHGFNDTLGAMGEHDAAEDPVGPSRATATGEFDKLLVNYQRLQRLGKSSDLLIRLSAQLSGDVLVPLQQLALGGPDTVRAYSSAERLADTGGFASLEWILRAPGFADCLAFDGHKWGDILQFSLFIDYGYGELNEPTPTDAEFGLDEFDLAGWGGAVQLSVPDGIFARLDVATSITDVCEDRSPTAPGECFSPANDRNPQYWFRLGYRF